MKKIVKTMCFTFLLLLCFHSCQQEKLLVTEKSHSNDEIASRSDCDFLVEFDVEMSMRRRPRDPNPTVSVSVSDRVANTPTVTRNWISACYDETGTVEMEIIEKQPTVSFEGQHETPQDPDLSEFKSATIKDNKMTIFGKKGEKILEEPFLANDLAVFVKELVTVTGQPSNNFQDFVNHPPDGITITILSGNSGAAPSAGGANTYVSAEKIDAQGHRTVNIFDQNRGLLLGSRVYDTDNKLLLTNLLQWRCDAPSGENPKIKYMYQSTYDTSPTTGIEMVTEIIYQFHTFYSENNINN